MGKFKRFLSFLINISLIGGTYFVSNAASLTKKEISKFDKILNDQKSKVKDKVKSEVKKYISKETKNDQKSDKNKKDKDKVSAKYKNPSVVKDENESKNEDGRSENSQVYFKIPLKLNNCKSGYERAIFLESLYNKLFEKNILEDLAQPLGLSEKYDLYSIILNNNNKDAIYVTTEESNEKKLMKKIKSDEFKNFIENFKITSDEFKKSKENIDKILKHDKEDVEKNIRNYKLGENVELTLPFSNGDKNITKSYYDSRIRPFIRTFDRKLIDRVNNKVDGSVFSEQFLKSSLKNIKQNNINEFNKTLEKFTSKKDSLFNKFNNVYFGSNIMNANAKRNGEAEKKETIETFSLQGANGVCNLHEFSPAEIAIGLFGSLNLNNQEKLEFKHYYEGKLREYNSKPEQQKNEQSKKEAKSILNFYIENHKKSKSKEEKEKDEGAVTEFKSILQDDAKFNEFAKEYGALKKSYFENFVNLLKDVKKE